MRSAAMLAVTALLNFVAVGAKEAGDAGVPEACQILDKEHVLLQRAARSSRRLQGEKAVMGGVVECSASIEGDECHAAVKWAQNHGVVTHPEWYGGLTHHSTFEEFQDLFERRGQNKCERPCNVCHTAVPGEKCHEDVQWAMMHGIREHPDWYPGLLVGSSFEEFQNSLHQDEHSACPEPCNLCRTVVDDEELCYKEVEWAVQHGIKLHPEWYPGLTGRSSRQEFQAFLSKKFDCPPACGVCHTADYGEPCHEGVMWAMRHGIRAHPEWYPDLTSNSSFVEFQLHLHRGGFKNCPKPCV